MWRMSCWFIPNKSLIPFTDFVEYNNRTIRRLCMISVRASRIAEGGECGWRNLSDLDVWIGGWECDGDYEAARVAYGVEEVVERVKMYFSFNLSSTLNAVTVLGKDGR